MVKKNYTAMLGFVLLLSTAFSCLAGNRIGDVERYSPNAEAYGKVDDYGYRTSKRPFMAPSWRGGLGRRPLRNGMAPLIGSVETLQRMVSQMRSVVNRFASRKNIKITKDDVESKVAEAVQKMEAASSGDDDYVPRIEFNDRRGNVLSGFADFCWDYFWGGGTGFVGLFRKNYRKKDTVDRRFRQLYRELDRLLDQVVRLKIMLTFCIDRIGTFAGKDAFLLELKAIEFNHAKAAKVKKSQEGLQANYADGNSQIVPVWESFRDYLKIEMDYLQNVKAFLIKHLENKYSILNSLPAVKPTRLVAAS